MTNLVTSYWQLAGGNSWLTANAWNGPVPQTSNANAVLATLAQPYTVTLAVPVTIGLLEVDTGVTLSLMTGASAVDYRLRLPVVERRALWRHHSRRRSHPFIWSPERSQQR